MSLTFAHPPHPSEALQRSPPLILALHGAEENAKDPHTFPTFDDKSLTSPQSPVLYLPPLLSSLPERLELPPPTPSDTTPLVTETRLPDIDPASLSLHKALHHFRPIVSNYAATPYAEAFNWSTLRLPKDEEREWYCVVFRSKRKAGSDGGSLYDADKKAHDEAIRNGGLILYWYGIPNQETGMNLATCIWQSRRHAIAANSRRHHIQAMKLAAESYEIYHLERYILRKVAGEGGVTIQPYESGEVGW